MTISRLCRAADVTAGMWVWVRFGRRALPDWYRVHARPDGALDLEFPHRRARWVMQVAAGDLLWAAEDRPAEPQVTVDRVRSVLAAARCGWDFEVASFDGAVAVWWEDGPTQAWVLQRLLAVWPHLPVHVRREESEELLAAAVVRGERLCDPVAIPTVERVLATVNADEFDPVEFLAGKVLIASVDLPVVAMLCQVMARLTLPVLLATLDAHLPSMPPMCRWCTGPARFRVRSLSDEVGQLACRSCVAELVAVSEQPEVSVVPANEEADR